MDKVNFKIDTRLASILSENYRSSENALKELVDNAWDADAENVWITIPEIMSSAPIIVKDDGSGMTSKEVENEYLFIANSKVSRKGDVSPIKNRVIKGRKGIGKFAGLFIANEMQLVTKARGIESTLIIDKEKLLKSDIDIEKVDLSIEATACKNGLHGTEIKLLLLNQKFTAPVISYLSKILITEYGRENDFNIIVNSEPLNVSNLPGDHSRESAKLPKAGDVIVDFTICDPKVKPKGPGLSIRVNGKIVGKPHYFGLDEDDDIPSKLLKRVYGEVEADGLIDDVTADWGSIFENSKVMHEITEYVKPIVRAALIKKYGVEINLQKARIQKKINHELEKLPENKRSFAQKALDKILNKYYGEKDEKIDTVISVVLDALERDEYMEVLEHIDESQNYDVGVFAEALSKFGLVEISQVVNQIDSKKQYLNHLENIIFNMDSLESDIHKALENSLWVFGFQYNLMSSNQTLKKIIDNYTDKKFSGERKDKRPDLLLSQNILNKYLLIEFKRTSHTIKRKDENQAEEYRDDLHEYFPEYDIDIILIGGSVDPKMTGQYKNEKVQLLSYVNLISSAREQLEAFLNTGI